MLKKCAFLLPLVVLCLSCGLQFIESTNHVFRFSRGSGIVESDFQLSIESGRDTTVYYTLDGSEPDPGRLNADPILNPDGTSYTETTLVYTGPIRIGDRTGEPTRIAQIPTSKMPTGFRNDNSPSWWGGNWLPPLAPVPQGVVVRARAYQGGQPVSGTITASFLPKIEPIAKLPVVSLVGNAGGYFDYYRGIDVPGSSLGLSEPQDAFAQIYGNYSSSGPSWERASFFEYLATSSTNRIALDIGVRSGGQARGQPFRALDFEVRSEYGPSWLNSALIDPSVVKYKRFKIRSGGSVWHTSFFNDEWGQGLFADTDLDIQWYKTIGLFLNGEFWGIGSLRDSYDEHYLESKYGFDESLGENLDFFENTSYDLGDGTHYDTMIEFLDNRTTGGSVPLSDADFQAVSAQMDMGNFARFQAAITTVGSERFPNNHNDKRWRTRRSYDGIDVGDGRWRWMLIDMDAAFEGYSSLGLFSNAYGPMRFLISNPAFKALYLNQLQDWFNTRASSENIGAYLDAKIAEATPWIESQYQRWQYPQPSTFTAFWATFRARAVDRPNSTRAELGTYFGLTSEPILVSVSGKGKVMVNTVEIEHGEYFSGQPVPVLALPETGQRFDHWSTEGGVSVADMSDPKTTFEMSAGGGKLTAVFQEVSP